MKICLIADIHLFSTEIGGNWYENSFKIFREKILTKIEESNPELVVLLGDIIDPHSGRSTPTWPRGDKANLLFTYALKKRGLDCYVLKGNHDYEEPLISASEMGGPKFIDDNWITFEEDDIAFYFFTSRYPNLKKASEDLLSIPSIDCGKKVLFMHENLNIRDAENVPREVMEDVCKKFDVVFCGHHHCYSKPYENVYCLSSALPWRVGYGTNDIEIKWDDTNPEPEIVENGGRFGFWMFDTSTFELNFVPVDIGVRTVLAKLHFSDASASTVRDRLIRLSELVSNLSEPSNTIVRVYLEGTLKEGDERIDVGFGDIEEKYYSHFYEGKGKNVIRVSMLRGGGAYMSKEDLRYISVEEALKHLESDIPEIRQFYEEVYDLIERKSFNGEELIERVKRSEVLDNVMEREK